MDPNRWLRVKEIFQLCLERAPVERESLLDELCGADVQLRTEVRGLLDCHEEDDFLESPAAVSTGSIGLDASSAALVGGTIGPYRLVSEIGRGGMGAVYLGVRSDEQFEQRVAVKLIRPGLDGEAVLRRFRQERQILARLEHPNIARLLDGGSTEEGWPYFVMEHVEGTPIDRYCDEHRLTIAQRLRLVRAVCSAVQYAHQRLVLHRDLKPGNILVTAQGEPKLLDFGIAKLLDPDLTAAPTRLTELWTRPLTPEYASPEQLRGDTVSTAADVYSLGVLLYELLSGRLPYRFESRRPEAALRLLEESELERPSDAVGRLENLAADEYASASALTPEQVSSVREGSPERLRRRLQGDLDNIVLKALARRPEERYASVEQLSEDLRRHLDGLPVSARSPGLGYRMAKFARRHRFGVLAAGAVAVLLLTLVVLSVVYAISLQRERNAAFAARAEAEQKEREATEITEFLVDLFEVPDPASARGRTITAREILENGAERIEQELASQPRTRARLMTVIGRVLSNLGMRREAVELLQQAVDLLSSELGDDDLTLAEGLETLAVSFSANRDWVAAEERYREALAIRLRHQSPKAPDVAQAKRRLAEVLRFQGRLDEADALSREALEALTEVLGEDDPQTLAALHARALVLSGRDETADAILLYRDLLERRRRLQGADHPDVPAQLNNLGFLHRRRGELAEAERYYRESLDLLERLVGEEHPNVVMVTRNLASVLLEQGKLDEAESALSRMIEVQRRSLPAGDAQIGHSLVKGLANVLLRQERYAEAEPLLREGVSIFEQVLGEDDRRTAVAWGYLAVSLLGQGRQGEAGRLVEKSVDALSKQQRLTSSSWISVEQIANYFMILEAEDEAALYRSLLTEERRPPQGAQN